jgi:hypothetical protein
VTAPPATAPPAGDDEELEARLFRPERPTYRLTRFVLLRAIGAVYLVAFLSLADQIVPLVGERGLLPAESELAFRDAFVPTIFEVIGASDAALLAAAWIGAALALAVVLGATNALLMAALWALQLSFRGVGQIFLGYGWEILLCEVGFLAIFLCPLRDVRPFPKGFDASPVVIGLFRWLLFRLMFGAGLIKLRGAECWRDLTCLDFHYETQPLPSPLSWLWHGLPPPLLHGGVLFNHVVELVVPFGLFGPRWVRLAAGIVTIVFQLFLALSGNLSYLNWLTIAIGLACFDDGQLARVLRKEAPPAARPDGVRAATPIVLAVVIGMLSVAPVVNMLSPDQVMNASFDPFHLVNTYGAFGSVNRTRRELVIEGTRDEDPVHAQWRAYALPCQPGPVERRPCFVAPWPLRLDWQMWFAARGDEPANEDWLVHLLWQILRGDDDVLHLFSHVPFPSRAPPRWVRVQRWRYRFAPGGEAWWIRDREETWARPLSLDDPALRDYVRTAGWKD